MIGLKFFARIRIAQALILTVGLIGCDSMSTPGVNPATSALISSAKALTPQTSALNLNVARRREVKFKLMQQQYTSIVLDIAQVIFLDSHGNDQQTIIVDRQIDLMKSDEGFGVLLDGLILPAGTYKGIRVILGPNS